MKASDIKPGVVIRNTFFRKDFIGDCMLILDVQSNPWEPNIKIVKYIYNSKILTSRFSATDINWLELLIA